MIGAGAVGIVLAVTLARAGRRVTVIEAGPGEPPVDYQQANAAASTGRSHQGLIGGRMKALGGTTRLWGGQLVPFSASDLAAETWPGKPEWPIAHAELAAATTRVLALLGVPEDARDPDDIYRRMTGRSTCLSERIEITATAWLPQPDFARLFAHDLATLPGLTVLTGHAVHDMHFAAPGRADCIIARSASGAEIHIGARQIVLACGTFEIVRLLLVLAHRHADCGFAENRHIGRWFIDHLHGVVGHFETIDRARVHAMLDPIWHRGRKYAVKLRLSDGYQQQAQLSNVAGMVLAPLTARQLVGEVRLLARRLFSGRGGPAAAWAAVQRLRLLAPLIWRFLVHRRAAGVLDRGAAFGVEIEQLPCADSLIRLDADDPERIALHWAFTGAEMLGVRAFAEAVRDSLAAEGLGRLVLDPRVEAADPAFLASCGDAYHQMGGARMAARAEDGVVDAQMRVFGTANLYVAGAATFPSGSFANPTLTAMALAVRLAGHLLEQAP